MIARTILLEEINKFIINQLEGIYDSNKNITQKDAVFKYSKKDQKFGTVHFCKKESDSYIEIKFYSCRYGYDFYNNDPSTKITDECCVCYEKTQDVIHCGHKICGSCVTEIMKHSKTLNCPMCRKNHESNNGLIIKYPMHLVTLLFD